MKDYRTMSPCERVAYYRERLTALLATPRGRQGVMVETLKQLIAENRAQCSEAPSARGR